MFSIVTNAIERAAREMRAHAERMENRAEMIEHIEVPDPYGSDLALMAKNLRRDAIGLRATAKLLDGKD